MTRTVRRRQGIAQRREVEILLPAALLVLVLLSTYTLFSYRGAVELVLDDRRGEAADMARQLAGELAASRLPLDPEALRRRMPLARGISVVDAGGGRVASVETSAGGVVAGTARFQRGAETFTVRVELPAAVALSRQRGLRILSPVLLTVNAAVTLLVLLFLRRFLAPFDRMVERARRAGQEVPDSQDEAVFLVETFEKALEALAEKPAGEAELDEMKALEGTLARSLESGVLLLDAEGTVLALNEVGAALLEIDGLRTGAPLAAVLERHPRMTALLENALRREQPVQRVECAVTTAAGERTLGLTAHPLRRDDGRPRGYLVIFADLTEIQREVKEQQLAESLSQLGELTAGVAHELRNSLATLRGYLSLIERDPENASIDAYLGEIRHESDHLKRVLEDFLTFARPGSARPCEVDLLGLAHRAAADPALGGAAVAVEAAGGARAFVVRGDPQLLERALRNVLGNAVEAQRAAGGGDGREEPVRARLTSDGAGVEILIEDRGGGLSAEAREKLFDPFFTQRPGGVGLGLALTRRIVLLHAGRIELENRAEGGTRARLWIPRGKIDTEGNNSPESPRRASLSDGDTTR